MTSAHSIVWRITSINSVTPDRERASKMLAFVAEHIDMLPMTDPDNTAVIEAMNEYTADIR